jgi:hypothetical protein
MQQYQQPKKRSICQFIFSCGSYYNYTKGYTPNLRIRFQGSCQIIKSGLKI